MINLAQLLPEFVRSPAMVTSVSIDTRTIKKGALFVAISGERFDGHDFVRQAFKKGAAFCLVERLDKTIDTHLQIVVPKTLKALQLLARRYRETFSHPVLALTGSSGKTSVKEMIAQTLDCSYLATRGNLNNHLGVPLTLLELNEEQQAAVIELGANHVGEIADTVALVKPDCALITNIGEAHIAEFGGIDNTEKAKGEIFFGVHEKGTLVVNLDDARVCHQAHFHQQKKITVSMKDRQADLFAYDYFDKAGAGVNFTLLHQQKTYKVKLQVPGLHNVMNALLALAASLVLQQSLDTAIARLSDYKGVQGRLNRQVLKNDVILIDDTYNANLESVLAAIAVLSKERGHRTLVLGELAEVGARLPHQKEVIYEAICQNNIESFYTLGDESFRFSEVLSQNYQHFIKKEDLSQVLKERIGPQSILVKGSRCAKMEEVIQLFKEE